jgi:hypothetical protein
LGYYHPPGSSRSHNPLEQDHANVEHPLRAPAKPLRAIRLKNPGKAEELSIAYERGEEPLLVVRQPRVLLTTEGLEVAPRQSAASTGKLNP